MRKIIALAMVTLDGVMQSPGGPLEDPENGFAKGGWVAPYSDEMSAQALKEELKQTDYLLGRKTFEIWENYWPHHGDFWPGINAGTKYVLSSTRQSSTWEHSVFMKDLDAIRALRESDGPDLQVWGSTELMHLLFSQNWVDELRLKIYPVVLGRGKKLFDDSAGPSAFVLTETKATPRGVVINVYQKAGEVMTGEIGA